MKSRKRNVGEPQVARESHFAHRWPMCLFIFIAFIMFYCSLTFHCELRPPGILHVPIWLSAQFKFETPALKGLNSSLPQWVGELWL